MKKKIYYWSPCLNPIGTIISTINSINAVNQYSKIYKACIINSCGDARKDRDILKKRLGKKI